MDVRDAALGHVLALEKEAAGGQRIITAGGARHVNLILISQWFLNSIDHIGAYNWQDWSTCFRSLNINIHPMLMCISL